MSDQQTTIDFDPPIEVNKVKLSQITLTEPTLGQVRDAQLKLDDALNPSVGSFREYELTFVQLNSGKGRVLIDAMPISALRRGVSFLERFVVQSLPDAETDVEPDRLTINLSVPLKTASGGEVSEITLREPTGGEARKAEELIDRARRPGTLRRYEARLIELVSGLPALVVAQMPISKAKQAIAFLEGFESSARPTPTT